VNNPKQEPLFFENREREFLGKIIFDIFDTQNKKSTSRENKYLLLHNF